MSETIEYDLIVIGAGHAGCEAALSGARMGKKTLIFSMNLDAIAQMSCNPAIGGLAKGHIVREIDALGGEMAKISDKTAIQYRMLNTKKGPAVWAPRAQCDRKLYRAAMQKTIQAQANLEVMQQEAVEIITESRKAKGVITKTGMRFYSKAVIVATGTFLNGLVHIGEKTYPAGRAGEPPSLGLSESLKALGFEIKRLKTGTPPRVSKSSLDVSGLQPQHGDDKPCFFSYSTKELTLPQVPCYITYTNKETHRILEENLSRAPLYTGQIKATGPRYCPSIEVKIVKFSDKERHQVFIEPEGLDSDEMYLNGLATSMPEDVQLDMVRSIPGLENARITRFGYAIEYDFAPPQQLKPTLETKLIENLYFAGQINGTSGYEEAAGQGLLAGINAVLKLDGRTFILGRHEAYLGVLVDDLVTKGTEEPYRMFTSRAEYRLLLRQDNADIRLTEYGHEFGLVCNKRYNKMLDKKHQVTQAVECLKRGRETGFDEEINKQAEIEIKYEGYIKRELNRVEKLKKLEKLLIPQNVEYDNIKGLRKEAKEKLSSIKPHSIGQAGRISGISPCDISMLLVYLEKNR
ncbi:MAG: tRNA uridine-5-carboxymethylaminomethyl(34) synthesis enzyme MnmG [Candidatus Omnitrophota bacterium]